MTNNQKAVRIVGDVVVILGILVLGVALLTLAVPRTAAYSKMAPGKAVLSDLAQGKPTSPERLRHAITGHSEALRWLDSADGWANIGALSLALARQEGLPENVRFTLLQKSRSAFQTGLALAPRRPFAWVQLAQVHQMLDPNATLVGPLLGMASEVGPLEPRLVTQRVRIGYAARTALSASMTRRLVSDIHLWAQHEPDSLADWARGRYALPWVRRALKNDEALHTQFLASYLRLPAR